MYGDIIHPIPKLLFHTITNFCEMVVKFFFFEDEFKHLLWLLFDVMLIKISATIPLPIVISKRACANTIEKNHVFFLPYYRNIIKNKIKAV